MSSIEPGVSPPVPINVKKPAYTKEGMLRRLQGEVTLSAVVRADGTVDDIQLIKPLDNNNFGLDQQAITALEESTFRSGTRNGEAVDMRITVQMAFNMRGSPQQ